MIEKKILCYNRVPVTIIAVYTFIIIIIIITIMFCNIRLDNLHAD